MCVDGAATPACVQPALNADAARRYAPPRRAGAAPHSRADLAQAQRRRGRQGAFRAPRPAASACCAAHAAALGFRALALRRSSALPRGGALRGAHHYRCRCRVAANSLARLAATRRSSLVAAWPPLACASVGGADLRPFLPATQEELYSYVTVVDTPEGFHGLGTKTVDAA